MPPNEHAVLSASSSNRWLNCPPSARLCEIYEDRSSNFAAEGMDAHALCEFRLKQALGIPAENPIESLTWYNREMEDCAAGYVAYISELLETAKQTCSDPQVMIEQRVDYARWVEQGFGTADCVIIADGCMNIVDYKHGQGVGVSAEENPQMMLYALGALEIFDGIYDIDEIRMTIYQPRKGNISVCVMKKDRLLEWANNDLVRKAKLAYAGDGEFHCGEWCRFCKAKSVCRERADANMKLARYDFEEPALLTDEEISEILGKVDALTAWANDVKDYALRQAVNGKSVPPLTAIKTPLRDGDLERPDDPAYANAYFINANSATAPGIVDVDRNPVLTRSEVYSGVYGRASINLYAFNTNGNKGIACGLNNLQLIRPGEPLGGKASAESDFATDDDDDFLD